MNSTLTILLSTYNGEAFLREQIESLQAQTFRDWVLCVRDDGSKDTSREILKQVAAQDPRVHFFAEDHEHLGVVRSYGKLLTLARDAAYIAFCDQDDFWLPHKIEISLRRMQEAEHIYGAETPLALHTDLKICDERLEGISQSAKDKERGLGSPFLNFSRLLGQNYVTGCTLLINHSLAACAGPISPDALMHDWWIALIAAALGKIIFLPEATLLYRQHVQNTSGSARPLSLSRGLQKFLSESEKMKRLMQGRFRQSKALEKHLSTYAPNSALYILQYLHKNVQQGALPAVRAAWKSGIRMSDLPRDIAYYYLLGRGAQKKLLLSEL